MSRGLILSLAVLLGAGIAGCGSSSSSGDEANLDDLVGTWETPEGYYVVRGADGVQSIGYSAQGAVSNPFGSDTWTFDGETFTLIGDPGTFCGSVNMGVYKVVIAEGGDVVRLSLVEDACFERGQRMAGDQTRYEP